MIQNNYPLKNQIDQNCKEIALKYGYIHSSEFNEKFAIQKLRIFEKANYIAHLVKLKNGDKNLVMKHYITCNKEKVPLLTQKFEQLQQLKKINQKTQIFYHEMFNFQDMQTNSCQQIFELGVFIDEEIIQGFSSLHALNFINQMKTQEVENFFFQLLTRTVNSYKNAHSVQIKKGKVKLKDILIKVVNTGNNIQIDDIIINHWGRLSFKGIKEIPNSQIVQDDIFQLGILMLKLFQVPKDEIHQIIQLLAYPYYYKEETYLKKLNIILETYIQHQYGNAVFDTLLEILDPDIQNRISIEDIVQLLQQDQNTIMRRSSEHFQSLKQKKKLLQKQNAQIKQYFIFNNINEADIRCVSFSNKNNLIATGDYQNKICIWDFFNQFPILIFNNHTSIVNSIEFDLEGEHLVSGSSDQSVNVYSIKENKCLGTLNFNGKIFSVKTSNNNNYKYLTLIASGSFLYMIDFKKLQKIKVVQTSSSQFWDLCWSDSGRFIASVSPDGLCRVFSIKSFLQRNSQKEILILKQQFQDEKQWLMTVAISNCDRFICSGGVDGTVILWDILKKQKLACFSAHNQDIYNYVWSVRFLHDNIIISGGTDGLIVFSDFKGNELSKYKADGSILSMAVSKNFKNIISVGQDKKVTVWMNQNLSENLY